MSLEKNNKIYIAFFIVVILLFGLGSLALAYSINDNSKEQSYRQDVTMVNQIPKQNTKEEKTTVLGQTLREQQQLSHHYHANYYGSDKYVDPHNVNTNNIEINLHTSTSYSNRYYGGYSSRPYYKQYYGNYYKPYYKNYHPYRPRYYNSYHPYYNHGFSYQSNYNNYKYQYW
jgi:hypothetical protein